MPSRSENGDRTTPIGRKRISSAHLRTFSALTSLDDITGLDATAITHKRMSAMPASVTVGEVRAYFAESSSRQLAVFTDGDDRYVGSLGAAALPANAPDDAPASAFSERGTTVPPTAPADEARDLALAEPSKRLPVVEADGTLVGIVAIDTTLTRFCGT
jgi:Mg/Co/Ni transporter MgtE